MFNLGLKEKFDTKDSNYPLNTWELKKEIKKLEEVIEEMHDVIKLLEEEHEEDLADLASVIRYLEDKIKDAEYKDASLTSDEINKMVGG